MHIVRKVTDNLYWIGANDHRLTLFENILIRFRKESAITLIFFWIRKQ